VFLASLKAAGLGTNLTAGSHVHMMDPWWNPAVEDQAMVRQSRTLDVVWLHGTNGASSLLLLVDLANEAASCHIIG
jgi:hypothetical protein